MRGRWTERARGGTLPILALLLGMAAPALASLPRAAPELPSYSATTELKVKMRNQEGSQVLGKMLNDDAFWADAWKKSYDKKDYDEIRLKSADSGYIPMITGEADQDFDREVVTHIIFNRMSRLPAHMSGAKAVVQLGKGYDAEMGSDYSDTFWFLDLTVLYVVYPMRMYRKIDEETKTSYLWFEKLEPSFVDAATWSKYQAKIDATKEKVDLRWAPFNSVNEVESLYGIFIVQPGKKHESRVTFVSKLAFGSDAGWLAKFGSQLPGVIKSGVRNGFVASVGIAREETERRAKSGG